MDRRSFVGMLGGLGALAPAAISEPAGEAKSSFYLLQSYRMRSGSQPARINDLFRKYAVPALQRHHPGPVIVLEAVVAPHLPELLLIVGYSSVDEFLQLQAKLLQDETLAKPWAEWETAAEPPFESQDNTLLMAAPYSPTIVPESRKAPRTFELRVYHAPSWRHLQALHERFAGAEVKIFDRCGIHPILYSSTLFGRNLPNLTYLIPFENLAGREKAWSAFGADPEWQRVRQESVEKNGQVVSVSQISLYRAAAYSPVQ